MKVQTLVLWQHWRCGILPGALLSSVVKLMGGLWGRASLLERHPRVTAASCTGALRCPGTLEPSLLLLKEVPRANNLSWAANGNVWGQSAL